MATVKENLEKEKKGELLQLISFSIEKEEYGIRVLDVIEVIRLPKVQKLPKSPEFLKGIISLRGEVIPIVDLRQRFGISEKMDDKFKRTIIIKVKDRKIGMIVDNVSKVIRVSESEIKEAPTFTSLIGSDYIKGIVMLNERMIILLDIQAIFSEDEMRQMGRVASTKTEDIEKISE